MRKPGTGASDRRTLSNEEQWRTEAFGAVFADEEWACVTAGVALGRPELYALYEHRLTSRRRMVTLPSGKFRTVGDRVAEIHRRLGMRARDEDHVRRGLGSPARGGAS
jgi:hypothetical protein